MNNTQTAAPPPGFNNPDWQLHKGNKNHVRFLDKCTELFWLIWEGQQLTGEAFFQQEWLASKLDITVRHVQNIIAELKAKKLIEVDRSDQNYYRVIEFFSRPLSEWTAIAKAKIKAELAKFFGTKQGKAQEQASRTRKESTAKVAKAEAVAQETPKPEPTEEERAALEIAQKEASAKITAEYEAQYEAEKKAKEERQALLKKEIEKVAEEVVRELPKQSIPSDYSFYSQITGKLKICGVIITKEVDGLIWETVRVCLNKIEIPRYEFR